MIIGMAAITISFIYTVIISIIYFSKEKVINFETKIFNILIVLSLVAMCLELHLCINVLINVETYSFYNMFLNRLFLLVMFGWMTLFTVYIYILSFYKGKSSSVKQIKSTKYLFLVFSVFAILSASLILTLPLEQFNNGIYSYSFGPAIDVVAISVIVYLVFCSISLIFRTNKTSYHKYYPLLILIISIAMAVIIRQINPGILLNSLPFSFAVLLLYFTIENPDVKLLNEILLAKDQAEKANRAKSDFLSSMSHEIRTPLNAIVGFTELVQGSSNLNKDEEESLSYIKNASDTLLDIINNILDMSKIESGDISINNNAYFSDDLLLSVSKLLEFKMNEKNLTFNVNIAPDIPKELLGDKTGIKKIITNLLSNAVKYTESGSVTYDVKCVINKDMCRLIITVSDTGRGIKKKILKNYLKNSSVLTKLIQL